MSAEESPTTDWSKLNLESFKVRVQFRSLFNLVWGKKIGGREALAFMRGFPGLFLMTDRRVILVAQFIEKHGWLQKKTLVTVAFEAGLDHLIHHEFTINAKEKLFHGYLKFSPHGQLGESILQFKKMDPKIAGAIEDYVKDLKIKNPLEDTGIVRFNLDLVEFVKSRLNKNK
jgi:hypothetical protein